MFPEMAQTYEDRAKDRTAFQKPSRRRARVTTGEIKCEAIGKGGQEKDGGGGGAPVSLSPCSRQAGPPAGTHTRRHTRARTPQVGPIQNAGERSSQSENSVSRGESDLLGTPSPQTLGTSEIDYFYFVPLMKSSSRPRA